MKPVKAKQREVPIRKRWKNLRLKPPEVRRALHALDACGRFSCPPGELSVVFMDDAEIARLHQEFFNDPDPTDVITFEGSPEMEFAGEICISAEHALAYARRHDIDFSRELTLYLAHGYLHLCGFDDLDPAAKRKMRAAEKNALAVLENSHLIPAFQVEERK